MGQFYLNKDTTEGRRFLGKMRRQAHAGVQNQSIGAVLSGRGPSLRSGFQYQKVNANPPRSARADCTM